MAKGKKGKNKFSYTSPLKKQVNKQIRQLGKDGKLNKKDVRKVSRTSGGGFGNKMVSNMIKRLGNKKDFDVTKKASKLISKFNVDKNPMNIPIPGFDPSKTPGSDPSVSEYVSSPEFYREQTVAKQSDELNAEVVDYKQMFLDQETDFEKRLMDMRETLTAQMNPQRRNPIFGVRNKRLGGKANSTTNSFGRGGKRISGIRNTSLNVT